ncbi:hypothetical protein STURO_v1c06160 [Spiroplasma turonicum]|nr:hypothetical protein STURO_v1c06160 [Spiroplasma turonicum]
MSQNLKKDLISKELKDKNQENKYLKTQYKNQKKV